MDINDKYVCLFLCAIIDMCLLCCVVFLKTCWRLVLTHYFHLIQSPLFAAKCSNVSGLYKCPCILPSLLHISPNGQSYFTCLLLRLAWYSSRCPKLGPRNHRASSLSSVPSIHPSLIIPCMWYQLTQWQEEILGK